MKTLIIGAAGFVGSYLIDELLLNNHRVIATKLPFEKINHNIEIIDLDIRDYGAVEKAIIDIKPDAIYHLAAQSSVYLSWQNPALTVDVNIKGTINLLEAVRKHSIHTKILIVGSSEEYGNIDYQEAISESSLLKPSNIYALSKLSAEMMASIYFKAYNLKVLMTRSFNHIGVLQSPLFVVADFCNQVAQIEKNNQEPVINVGNILVKRDFTDVSDIVKAYLLIIEKGQVGEVYNVGSGRTVLIKDLLDLIIRQSSKEIKIVVDQNKIRPNEICEIKADITKIKSLGWQPQKDIFKTTIAILNYFRGLLK